MKDFLSLLNEFILKYANAEKAKFDKSLITTKYKIYGIKNSDLQAFAKSIIKSGIQLPNFKISSHEEVLLCGMLIVYCKKSTRLKLEEIIKWLDFCDNWASCDMIACRVKKLDGIYEHMWFFDNLINSGKTYFQRFAIVCLMGKLKYNMEATLKKIMLVQNDNYNVKMAKAWALAEAAVYNFDYVKSLIQKEDDVFVKRKAISKCCDSLRLTQKQKQLLRDLR